MPKPEESVLEKVKILDSSDEESEEPMQKPIKKSAGRRSSAGTSKMTLEDVIEDKRAPGRRGSASKASVGRTQNTRTSITSSKREADSPRRSRAAGMNDSSARRSVTSKTSQEQESPSKSRKSNAAMDGSSARRSVTSRTSQERESPKKSRKPKAAGMDDSIARRRGSATNGMEDSSRASRDRKDPESPRRTRTSDDKGAKRAPESPRRIRTMEDTSATRRSDDVPKSPKKRTSKVERSDDFDERPSARDVKLTAPSGGRYKVIVDDQPARILLTEKFMSCFYKEGRVNVFDMNWQDVNRIVANKAGSDVPKLKITTLNGQKYLLTFPSREKLEMARTEMNGLWNKEVGQDF